MARLIEWLRNILFVLWTNSDHPQGVYYYDGPVRIEADWLDQEEHGTYKSSD